MRELARRAEQDRADLFRATAQSMRVHEAIIEKDFWEKVTILHQEAHREEESPGPAHCSRHYYDTYRLSLLPIRDAAMAKPELLRNVVEFKMKFYRCRWARYEDAKPGSLRLLPPPHRFDGLRRDYAAMQAMLFGARPSFEAIQSELAGLEKSVNELKLA